MSKTEQEETATKESVFAEFTMGDKDVPHFIFDNASKLLCLATLLKNGRDDSGAIALSTAEQYGMAVILENTYDALIAASNKVEDVLKAKNATAKPGAARAA